MNRAARPPRIGVTLGDPRGIGPEVAAAALLSLIDDHTTPSSAVEFVLIGPPEAIAPGLRERPHLSVEPVGRWANGGERAAGRLSVECVERGIALALEGAIDGLVTAPISKAAIAAAGHPWPGHTELLRERCGVDDVTMIMGAEQTPLGGPLRIALLTVHVAFRDVPGLLTEALVERRSRIAATALRDWWEIARPRLAIAGLNPHASEGGLFGDEEERVLRPAMRRLERSGDVDASGPFPADTVFRRCIEGAADIVVAPYHDVGLAVLKTIAPENGINVTAGLPFPRTSPDHGTAFDIAGRGVADPRSMRAAVEACVRFCRAITKKRNESA
ncbi:MAG TPA: 4-hydroxythreonine-4-phosphate dehydrogenase PdxA [Gemmatimonadota bacterium]|nr:4-hydroxythreonine-4-phosphate dehydrogenase PdxA [Gemmatimonadota bacterium]